MRSWISVRMTGCLLAGIVLTSLPHCAWAQGDEEEGRIIQLAPDPGQQERRPDINVVPGAAGPAEPGGGAAVVAPAYWIGIMGGPIDPAVRHQLDLPADAGLMVLEVVPDSPAAKGGIKQYDILIRGNDVTLKQMNDLVELVIAQGEQQGQIALEVVRRGQTETVWVTPEARPAGAAVAPAERPPLEWRPGGRGPDEIFRELERMFPGGLGRGGFNFRNFGPGGVAGGQQMMSMAQLPNGVSIKVEKQNDQPPRITVEKNGEQWEVVGDDPKSLDQLPDDVRPFVEQMLQGGGASVWLEAPLEGIEPPRGGQDDDDLRSRLKEMERQMEALRSRLLPPAAEAPENK